MYFGFRKWRNCTIYEAKTKVLISCTITAKLICAIALNMQKSSFSHDAAHLLVYMYEKKKIIKLKIVNF